MRLRAAVIIYVVLSVFFSIFFYILDGWPGVRAHATSMVVVAGLALLGAGAVWLGNKLGISINDDRRIDE